MLHLRNILHSISFKTGIIIFNTLLIVLSIVGFTYIDQFSEQVDRRISTQVQIPGKLMQAGLLPYNSVEEKDPIRGLVGEDVIRALVVGIGKKVYFSPNSEDLGQDVSNISGMNAAIFDLDTPSNEVIFDNDRVINISPIYDLNNENLRMFLYLEVDTGEAKAEKTSMIRLFVLGSGITLIITAMTIYLTSRFIVARRITEVLTVMGEVESGNLTARAPGGESKDEIGVLHKGVNSMISQQEVLVNNLEGIVLDRTSKLERSNEDLAQFAYIASHDLQAPLRKILAFSGRLKDKYEDALDSRGIEYLSRMQDAAERGQHLINDLLELSQVTTKGKSLVQIDLGQILKDVVSTIEIQIEETKGKIVIGDLPRISGDPVQIHQLFQNLVGNALKFSRPATSPNVEVTALEIDKHQSQILIKDNGIGFDQDQIDKIFQPFKRLHSQEEYEGNGIGLAICKKIVERHGGSITATSNPGEGATFIITLPTTQTSSVK